MDLPLVAAHALADALLPLDDPVRLLVVLCLTGTAGARTLPCRATRSDRILFGGDSRAAHAACARENGARLIEIIGGPLSLDLDTPEDLPPRGHEPARRWSVAAFLMPTSHGVGFGRIEVASAVASPASPKIEPGDDLPAILCDAL